MKDAEIRPGIDTGSAEASSVLVNVLPVFLPFASLPRRARPALTDSEYESSSSKDSTLFAVVTYLKIGIAAPHSPWLRWLQAASQFRKPESGALGVCVPRRLQFDKPPPPNVDDYAGNLAAKTQPGINGALPQAGILACKDGMRWPGNGRKVARIIKPLGTERKPHRQAGSWRASALSGGSGLVETCLRPVSPRRVWEECWRRAGETPAFRLAGLAAAGCYVTCYVTSGCYLSQRRFSCRSPVETP